MINLKTLLGFTTISALATPVAGADFACNDVKDNAKQQPNFLILVCEDISSYLGCYGDDNAVTPYLDEFATQSILHENMFTCVGVSSPSRYSLITGRYSSSDGASYMRSNYFNKSFETVPPKGVKCYTEYLRKNGYYCTNNAKTDYQFHAPQSAWDEQGNKAHWKHAPKDQPFLATFNMNVTHESFIWKNSDKPTVVSPDSVTFPPYYPDDEVVRHDVAVLYTNIYKMDKWFHRLLSELEESDRADNTIVIFYSDNGGPLPRGKREIMDSGTKVPFMIRFPDGWGAGQKREAMNMFVDIPATVLSLANIQPPKYMHGEPMYGKYATQKEREFVFGATDRFDEQVEKRASIRNGRYLYIRNYMPSQSVYRPNAFRLQMPMMRDMVKRYEEGRLNNVQRRWFDAPALDEELYDCVSDPHQICNLSKDKRYAKTLAEMRDAFQKEWIERYNSKWVRYSEDDFIKEMWPNGVKPQAPKPIVHQANNQLIVENASSEVSVVYQINGSGIAGKKKHWMLYNGPIDVKSGDKLVLRVERLGYQPSKILHYSVQ